MIPGTVSVAILSVLALASAALMMHLSQSSSSVSATNGLNGTVQSLQQLLKHTTTCNSAIGSAQIFNSTQAQQVYPNGMEFSMNLGGPNGTSATAVQQGKILPNGVQVTHLQLSSAKKAGTDASGDQLWSGIVTLVATKMTDSPGGQGFEPRQVGLITVAVPGGGTKMQSCADSTSETNCPNGQLAVANGSGGYTCKTAAQLFGSIGAQLIGATCPSGYVPESNGSGVNCVAVASLTPPPASQSCPGVPPFDPRNPYWANYFTDYEHGHTPVQGAGGRLMGCQRQVITGSPFMEAVVVLVTMAPGVIVRTVYGNAKMANGLTSPCI